MASQLIGITDLQMLWNSCKVVNGYQDCILAQRWQTMPGQFNWVQPLNLKAWLSALRLD